MPYLFLVLTFFVPGGSSLLLPQETIFKSKLSFTSAKALTTKMSIANGGEIEISGKLIYTVTKINHNDSLEGKLTYIVSEKSFQDIARLLGKSIIGDEIKLSFDRVSALPQKSADCQVISLEFKQQLHSARVSGDAATILFNSFLLDIKTDDQKELDRLLCEWVKRIQAGRGGTRAIITQINHILEGAN